MFDWNDEELENIIWGEGGVNGDHIVPYPNINDGKPLLTSGYKNNKECQQECTKLNPGQSSSDVGTGSHGGQSDTSSIFGANSRQSVSGFSMASWTDLSSANGAKGKEDVATKYNDVNETRKLDSARDTSSLEVHNESSLQNHQEDKVDGDFADFGWGNIGSFDDIDKLFCNDDTVFGQVSLANADELWTSSKEIGGALAPRAPQVDPPMGNSLPLSWDVPMSTLGGSNNASDHIEIKEEYSHHEYQPSFMTGGSQWSDLKSPSQENVREFIDEGGYSVSNSKMILENQESSGVTGKITAPNLHVMSDNATTLINLVNKVNKKKKVVKYRKKSYEDGIMLQGPYGTGSQPGMQCQGSHISLSRPSGALPKKRQLPRAESSQYQYIPSSQAACAGYRSPLNRYSDVPQSSSSHPEVFVRNTTYTSHVENSVDPCIKPLTMTPQEKIEKLRKRQQLQALLAIQKQQQHINGIVSSGNSSVKENRNLSSGEDDIELEESLSSVPSHDTNLLLEKDASSTLCLTSDTNSLEGAILHQLQTVVSKLDIKDRLCIRDSLFRLAQSSERRHYATDSSSLKKMRGHKLKEEPKSYNSYPPRCDMETETNQTDRTIAHLLFHRHSETPSNQNGTPESPNSAMGSLFSTSGNMGNFLGPKYSHPLTKPQERDRYITSPCIDSQTASNPDLADGRSYGC